MIKRLLLAAAIVSTFASSFCSAQQIDMSSLFPDMPGWTKDGAPAKYYPENLFEYIDGAADQYIDYEFEELATLSYDTSLDFSLTIDIYRHSDDRNSFGIYSQEKPSKGNFMALGTQGYYEKGIFNFFQRRYYVKLAVFGLEGIDKTFLTSVASEISRRLGKRGDFPQPVSCFPDSGMIGNSVRYIAVNFLGHGFLESAFVADYAIGKKRFKMFIIEADGEAKANGMMEKYLKLAAKEGSEIQKYKGIHQFIDPYYKSAGMINLKRKGKYVWGLFGDDQDICQFFINETENKLLSSGLIQ